MPELQVSIVLPYYLRLTEGEYETGQPGEALQVVAPELVENEAPRTLIRAHFSHEDTPDQNAIQRQKARDSDHLLWRTNRLLRWYRTVTHRADILELTRAQASPFRFVVISGAADPAWSIPLQYEGAGPAALMLPGDEITNRVRDGLGSGAEPDVAELFLLDAERALHEGRFRETVLFCWSTIDSVFNQKYDRLVSAVLTGEWAEGRDFFTGIDYGLRHKMSAGMHLFANRSFFREPGDLWPAITVSYNKRNAIIHRGENTAEDDARQAMDVARRVVEIMNAIPIPAPAAVAAPPVMEVAPEPIDSEQAPPNPDVPGRPKLG